MYCWVSSTSAKYLSAVGILKDRYGKKSAVQGAHIQKLLSIERVRDDNDGACLHKVGDIVETYFRGLETLGAGKESYSSIVVPESLRLRIMRGRDYDKWTLDEVALHEEHHRRDLEKKNQE